MGPGQKMQQPHMVAARRSRASMSSTDNLGSQKMFSMTQRNIGTISSLITKPETKRETPVIKLTKVEESEPEVKQASSEEVSTPATVSSARSSQKKLSENQSVSEIFKQRIAQFRRSMSKGMTFAD
mmetsp:Transcript_35361/g.46544  ORF Transcript_35361/g.46544 Transcript_35361/m.46544 type:complete len:126 (+) Transcript_35361:527-904(+)